MTFTLYLVLIETHSDLWRFEVGAETFLEAIEFAKAHMKYSLDLNPQAFAHIVSGDEIGTTNDLGITHIGAVFR